MFLRKIRQKRTSDATGSEKIYESLQLVESCRTADGPRQKLLLNLGPIPLEKEDYTRSKMKPSFQIALVTYEEYAPDTI